MKHILLLILLTACGSYEESYRTKAITARIEDGQLQKIYDAYQVDLTRYGIYSVYYVKDIYYADLEEDTVGRCYFNYQKGNTIVIDPAVKDMPEYTLKFIMYHELGHCMQDYEHIDDKGLHIMNTAVNMRNPLILEHWNELVDALFTGK